MSRTELRIWNRDTSFLAFITLKNKNRKGNYYITDSKHLIFNLIFKAMSWAYYDYQNSAQRDDGICMKIHRL